MAAAACIFQLCWAFFFSILLLPLLPFSTSAAGEARPARRRATGPPPSGRTCNLHRRSLFFTAPQAAPLFSAAASLPPSSPSSPARLPFLRRPAATRLPHCFLCRCLASLLLSLPRRRASLLPPILHQNQQAALFSSSFFRRFLLHPPRPLLLFSPIDRRSSLLLPPPAPPLLLSRRSPFFPDPPPFFFFQSIRRRLFLDLPPAPPLLLPPPSPAAPSSSSPSAAAASPFHKPGRHIRSASLRRFFSSSPPRLLHSLPPLLHADRRLRRRPRPAASLPLLPSSGSISISILINALITVMN